MNTIISKTIEYLRVPSVVGHENFFMDYLRDDFAALGVSVFEHEGLLEVQGSSWSDAIVCAHIDRHGLISLGDDEYVYAAQYIREIKYGENNLSSRKEVESISRRFEGESIYAYHPETGEKLSEGMITACYPNIRNDDALFYVEGLSTLEQNIPLAYGRLARFEDDQIIGQIDNVISVALIYALYKHGYQGTALLTTEEEIGKSWIHIANYLDRSDIHAQNLLVLDTSPYTDQDIIDEGLIVLRNRDKSEIFNAALVGDIKQRCELLDIPYQVKDEYLLSQGKEISDLGSTELGRLIQGSNGFWSGATVQIPTLMYHTSNETTTKTATENYYDLLKSLLIEDKLTSLEVKSGGLVDA